jgi:transcription elongation factor Elf1
MRKPSVKPTEHKCPACNGTGFPTVMQPVKPSHKIYPIKCKNCGGKGRIAGPPTEAQPVWIPAA